MNSIQLENWFKTYKSKELYGRYINLLAIQPLIENLSNEIHVETLGYSENNQPIHLIKVGQGAKKLLLWSQMHGNESTTTKAVFDCLHMFTDVNNEVSSLILNNCTLYIVPMLSPDGAEAYTRLNYNQVDLNRDAQNKTQKESRILNDLIQSIQPDVAFNLHGQRTIFSAGKTNIPATVSFLSAAGDQNRTVTSSRKIAMEIIVEMNKILQNFIPNAVGRYDDGFNLNCVGDTLTYLGIPAILFEAGHYPNDYNREKTREYIFYALISSINYIANKDITGVNYEPYFSIPENEKLFYDIIIRDVVLDGKSVDIAIQYQEKLCENAIHFVPIVEKIENLRKFYGHREIIGNKREIYNENVTVGVVSGHELLNFSLDDELFSTDLTKK